MRASSKATRALLKPLMLGFLLSKAKYKFARLIHCNIIDFQRVACVPDRPACRQLELVTVQWADDASRSDQAISQRPGAVRTGGLCGVHCSSARAKNGDICLPDLENTPFSRRYPVKRTKVVLRFIR